MEIDAIGILSSPDGNTCLAVETKGGAETDEGLEKKIQDFSLKIESLRRQLPSLAQELGFNGTIDNLSGLFISMADLERYERGSYGIELWDYHRFTQELRRSGISKKHIEHLEMTKLTFVEEDLWGLPDFSLYRELPDLKDWTDEEY
jgi:hypothetical protein